MKSRYISQNCSPKYLALQPAATAYLDQIPRVWPVAGCTGAPFQFHSNNNLTKKTNFQVVCSVGTRPCPPAPGTAQSHFR